MCLPMATLVCPLGLERMKFYAITLLKKEVEESGPFLSISVVLGSFMGFQASVN